MEFINPTVKADLEAGKKLKLDLGGGPRKKEGYYGLDHLALDGVDILADLNSPLELLPNNCVQSIYSNHVLEHIQNLEGLIKEIYRVTMPGGEIDIRVPHFSNPYYYSDPTHLRFFGLYTMYYFVDTNEQPAKRKVPTFYSDIRFTIKDIRIDFFKVNPLDKILEPLLSKLINKNIRFQEFFERRLSKYVSAGQIRYLMTPVK